MSAAGGVEQAPARARAVESACLQLFTKQPSRWAEPEIDELRRRAFRSERMRHGIRVAGAHDSYLINLASPDPTLWERSYRCFEGELLRGRALGLDFVVTHPGNATDGDRVGGLGRNADALTRALEATSGGPRVLLELTAGSGHALGCSFEELGELFRRVPGQVRRRLGVCFDTCHGFAAGYDLVGDYDGVWSAFDDVLGLGRLALFHLNDSKTPLGSRSDRHENIGMGALGDGPFRRLVNDERFREIPKIIETPKGKDPVEADLRNLRRLRSLRERG